MGERRTSKDGEASFFLVSATPRTASPSSPSPSTKSSEGPISDFEAFLNRYRTGQFDMSKPIEPPASIMDILNHSSQHEDLQLYPTSENDAGQEAASLLDFYRRHRYLPAPKMPHEEERLRLMRRFGLDDATRKEAIQRISRLAKAYFRTDIVIITLTFSDKQVLAAETDWEGPGVEPSLNSPPRVTGRDPSFCSHNLLQADPQSLMVVDDASNDWRFKGNPFVVENGGNIGSYTAANINLPSKALRPSNNASETQLPEYLPVGSICLIGRQPRKAESFPNESRVALLDFAQMIARELQLAFEQDRRHRETLQAAFLTALLRKALVQSESTVLNKSSWASSVASELKRLTNAHAAVVIDYRSAQVRVPAQKFADEEVNEDAEHSRGSRRVSIVSADGPLRLDLCSDRKLEEAAGQAVVSYEMFCLSLYDSGTQESPLRAILPASTTASCIVPLFDLDQTLSFLIVLTSEDDHFRFDTEDVNFVEAVGHIILASSLREKATLADRAKLAFVSQVSHELRTPLHSVQSQLALLREFSSPSQLRRLSPLLDVADVCLESLRDVLDDTLVYAKLANKTSKEIQVAREEADLDGILDGILKATWIRKRRTELVEDESSKYDPVKHPENKVDVIYEKRMRAGGWDALVDAPGLKRVLLNLVGNALKFTERGNITISLETIPDSLSGFEMADDETLVKVQVRDTGRGMSEEFLREGKIFVPFLQENSFSHGAGLGMSICQEIMRRMKGKIEVTSALGKGTTVEIVFPVKFITNKSATQNGREESVHRRIVSDELERLFTARPEDHGTPTPAHEMASFDFSTSIKAARSTLSTNIESQAADAIAMDMAKLQIASQNTTTAPLNDLNLPVVSTDNTPNSSRPSSKNGLPFRVMVVDDNSIARTVLARLLAAKGIAYSVAADGVEAVELYSTLPHELIFMDFQMPRMDGLQAARAIRTIEEQRSLPRSRIVALTGLSAEADMAQESISGIEDPIDRWLTKGSGAMRTVIEEVTQLKQQLRSTST